MHCKMADLECISCEGVDNIQMKSVGVSTKGRTMTINPDGSWSSAGHGYGEGKCLVVKTNFYCSNCDTHFQIEQEYSNNHKVVMTISDTVV